MAKLDITDPAIETFFRDFRKYGGKAISWSGGGEPTLHPQFKDATELIASIGLDQGLVTHGAFPEELVRPIASRCAWVRISLDTHKPEAYAAQRQTKSGAFHRAVANAKLLVENGARVGINMNIARWNVDHIGGVYALASGIHAAYLQVRPTLPTPFVPKHQADLLCAGDVEKVLDDVRAISKSAANSTQIVVSTDKFQDLAKSEFGQQGRGCRSHRMFVVLDWTGDLMVCMYHLADRRFSFGNVYKHTFAEIWKSTRRKRVLEFCEKRLDRKKDGCQVCCKGQEINKVLFGEVESEPEARAAKLTSFL